MHDAGAPQDGAPRMIDAARATVNGGPLLAMPPMRIEIVADEQALAVRAADIICDAVRAEPGRAPRACRPATRRSRTYAELARRVAAGDGRLLARRRSTPSTSSPARRARRPARTASSTPSTSASASARCTARTRQRRTPTTHIRAFADAHPASRRPRPLRARHRRQRAHRLQRARLGARLARARRRPRRLRRAKRTPRRSARSTPYRRAA